MCGGGTGLFPTWDCGLGLGSVEKRMQAEAKGDFFFYKEL